MARTGITYGKFWRLKFLENTFSEVYGESFLLGPAKSVSLLTAAGWAKFGYRLYEKDQFIFDPLIVAFRVSDSTNRKYSGADYQLAQIGLQGSYVFLPNNVFTTIMLTRSWTRSQTLVSTNPYWLLFALGVNF